MKVFLPNSSFLGNIETFLNHLNTEESQKLEVSFHESWSAVHPVVLAMTAALALKCKASNGTFDVQPITAKSANYFKRLGLLDLLEVGKQIHLTEKESAGRFIGIRQVRNTEDLRNFIADLIPLLHTSPEQFEPIKYVISEVVRNSFEHSNSGIGVILCAQYYKKTNRVSVGIVDCGIGIMGHIGRNHVVRNHFEAIRLALRPGITGTTSRIGGSETNAGAGLFFTKSITRASGDYMMVYSGNALFKLRKNKLDKNGNLILHGDPMDDNHKVLKELPFWEGTVVGVDISSGQTGIFTDLMELIRNHYQLDISKRKEIFKKPKFT